MNKEGVYYSYTDPARPYAVTEGSDGFRVQYDNNGNMVAKTDPLGDEFVYSYDEENQLVKAVKNGSHTEDFTYDANGMRVRKTAGGAVTDYFHDGVNLLYEVTNGTGRNHVWANGTLLCTVQNNNYTYYHTDHLGTSKLQTDGQGKVVSIDITKPYGPVAREGVMSDTFSDLSKIDPERSRFQYDAATGTILPPTRGRGLPKQVTDNHEVTVEKTAYERVKNIRIIQTASDQVNTELKIEFDFVGKARLTVKNKAGDIVFQDEYSGTELKTKTIRVEVGYTLNQAYTIILELAARNASTPSRNTIFSVSWGEAEAEYGIVRSLPQTFQTDVYSVKLSFAGAGVTFYLNTGGKLWQRIEPGQETLLDQPGRTLTIRAYLTLDEGTNLQSYGLEINPYHDMSFTGKFLEPAIGLVYFGGRWYEPGIGRWVTVDPAGQGFCWHNYCQDNPINSIDPDGEFSYWLQPIWLYAGPTLYGWDILTGLWNNLKNNWISMLVPIPLQPLYYATIVAMTVRKNPEAFIEVAKSIGWSLVEDLVMTYRNFPHIFFGRPTDAEVREYGKNLVGAAITVYSAIKIVQAVKGIVAAGKVTKFYTIQSKADTARLLSGGEPWPTAASRSALGEGVYAWTNKKDALAYLERIKEAVPDARVVEFTIKNELLSKLKALNIDNLVDSNAWMEAHSKLWGGIPNNGLEFITRGTATGAIECFFSKTIMKYLRFLQ